MDDFPESIDTGSFDSLRDHLDQGCGVARRGWYSSGERVKIQIPDAHSKMTRPYLYMQTEDGERYPWAPTVEDILADDWFFYDADESEETVETLRAANTALRARLASMQTDAASSIPVYQPDDVDEQVEALEQAIAERDGEISRLLGEVNKAMAGSVAAGGDALTTSLMDKVGRAAASLKLIAEGRVEDDAAQAAQTLRNIGF
jgi:hypothetical protein